MRRVYLLTLIAFNVIWAGSLPAYKVLGDYLATGQIVLLRFGLAAVIMLVGWPLLPGRAPRGWDLIRTVIMGLLVFCAGHRLQVAGNNLGSVGNSAVLMALEPLLTSLAAAAFLREHVAPRRWLGFSLGMVGVGLLNRVWRPDFHWASLGASLLFITSFLSESAYSVIGKPMLERAGPMKILALGLAAGLVANLALDGPSTLARVGSLPVKAWLILAYLAVFCTVAGYTAWYIIIRETPVNVVVLTVFVQPIAAIPMATLWLGEPLHIGHLLGAGAIVAGLVAGLWADNQAPAVIPPEA